MENTTMDKERMDKLKELLSDEETRKELFAIKEPEDVREFLKKRGFEQSDNVN